MQLEWKYSPTTYLDEPISLEFEWGTLHIKNGSALAEINPEILYVNDLVCKKLTIKIETILLSAQLMTHKDFELRKPSRIDIREDGKKNYYLDAEPGKITISSEVVDIKILDKDGSIVSDTRKDRLAKQERYACLLEKFKADDVTLDQMLKSYQKAVKDPENEFLHLYEIRDALSKRFGSVKKSKASLGISKDKWNEIGSIANNLPLMESRHRGKFAGKLRNAKPMELEIARKSAVHLIDKYLEFLVASEAN